MKTLALVTVIFLPGTFVSALFAVPFFQWDADKGEKVLSGRFWIYWAVVVPLTILTVVPFIVWTRQKRAAHRRELVRAREKFVNDIRDVGGEMQGLTEKNVDAGDRSGSSLGQVAVPEPRRRYTYPWKRPGRMMT